MAGKKGITRRQALTYGAGAVVGLGAAAATGAHLYLSNETVQHGLTYRPKINDAGSAIEPIKEPLQYGLENLVTETLFTHDTEDFLIWRSEDFDRKKPTLMFYPGGIGHLGDTHMGEDPLENKYAYIDYIKRAQQEGWNIIACNHVGYADSDATPNQHAIFRGVERSIEYALIEARLQPNDLRIFGISFGGPLACHAAKYLSTVFPSFKNDPTQHIHFIAANSAIDIPSISHDLTGIPEGYVRSIWNGNEMYDAAAELRAMGSLPKQQRMRVHGAYLSGSNDELTNSRHADFHKEAGKNLGEYGLRSFTVPGKHFIDFDDVIDKFTTLKLESKIQDRTSLRHIRNRAIAHEFNGQPI